MRRCFGREKISGHHGVSAAVLGPVWTGRQPLHEHLFEEVLALMDSRKSLQDIYGRDAEDKLGIRPRADIRMDTAGR
jgi:hypothetical protein